MSFIDKLKFPVWWLWVSLGLTLVLGILTRITGLHGFYIAFVISIIPWGLFVVIGIIFAWIVNPIIALKEKRRKNKEE